MNEKTRGQRRAETAKRNDDSDILENAEPVAGEQGSSGGVLQRDVGSQASTEKVKDPAAHGRRTKEDEIARGEFSPGQRSAAEVVSERKG